MSNAVTDTHALIWYLSGSPRLGSGASRFLISAIEVN